MKSVLISINPKWCELIASGKKTVEVRKTRPHISPPFKVYIYCTKPPRGRANMYDAFGFGDNAVEYGGKVMGEFICNKIEDLHEFILEPRNKYEQQTIDEILKASCLSFGELCEYLNEREYYKPFYIWHISSLVIYEKPKELYDFVSYNKHEVCLQKNCFSGDCWGCPNNAIMVRPPQSWCYVKAIPDIKNDND